jgi:hypothetical protein
MKRTLLSFTVIAAIMPSIAAANTNSEIKAIKNQMATMSEKLEALENKEEAVKKGKKSWTEKLKISGYLQFRNTAWLDGEDEINDGGFKGYWADGSTQNDKNFFIRRARVILSGDIGDHLGIYFQPDFASNGNNTGQLRDFYGDVYIDKEKVHRVRLGQSKVPYSFENMQSSSKRLTLDRNDALNSAARDERDIGAFYYYTPVAVQELFKEIDEKGLKSTGNYGMFALGFYNGQGANNSEKNDNYHVVARITYPFKTQSGQIYEFGVQGYSGKYVSPNIHKDTVLADPKGIADERIGISAMIYPQPFGFQAEWNWGKTPGAENDSVKSTTISEQDINGGYLQAMYRMTNVFKEKDVLTPFVKWQYFDGYSKAEYNSPRNDVNDWEIGAEWQIAKEFELTLVYHKMNRSNIAESSESKGTNGYGEQFKGSALRIQAQMNF